MLFQGYLKENLGFLRGKFKGVSMQFQGYSKEVQGVFMEVSKLFSLKLKLDTKITLDYLPSTHHQQQTFLMVLGLVGG